MTTTIRLATRSSPQAHAQTKGIAHELQSIFPQLNVEFVFVEPLGDQRKDVPLHTIGGQGVFVKEVQRAVLDGHADIAVHSAKDMPSALTDGLVIAAYGHRRNPCDAMIGARLDELETGATVSTGSVRRKAQLAQVRPDLVFTELRGNIHSRLAKIPQVNGQRGAIVMAVAALEILRLTEEIAEVLPADQFVPAPGQGCVAVECRSDDLETIDLLAAIDHHASRDNVEVERAFLAQLGTGCSLPVGAYADGMYLTGFLASDDCTHALTRTVTLPDDREQRMQTAARLAAQLHRDVSATVS